MPAYMHDLKGDAEMTDEDHAKPKTSFEVANCYTLACKAEVKLSTGCKILNDFLRGGILPRRIYEVYGESGTGKTQLAIQLILQVINISLTIFRHF